MKKSHLIFTIMLFMVVGYAAMQVRMNVEGKTSLSENLDDFNVYLANLKLNNTEIEGINETKDGYVINVPSKGTLEYDIVNDSTEYDVETSVECEEETEEKTWTFDYTGGEQTFTVPTSGTYKLETWGAQGATDSTNYHGGYGGYSVGKVNLEKSSKLYIYVGEKGKNANTSLASNEIFSYPNGGSIKVIKSDNNNITLSSGGGSTHISSKSGLIADLENSKANIILVAGGGGGVCTWWGYSDHGGSGGGYIGGTTKVNFRNDSISNNNPGGGTQISGGTGGGNLDGNSSTSYLCGIFGRGGGANTAIHTSGAGGGGYYGGGASWGGSGAGGSGYIGNSLLTEKSMYCYNCEESAEESTKTVSTTCVNETPTENCAKIGNGYARITGINIELPTTQLTTTTIEAQDKINNKVEVENNGMKCNLKIKKISRTEKKVYTGPTEWTFDYTGDEQTFTVPVNGTYKLETWGAQGGDATSTYIGGYGGYSTGQINIKKNVNLYINVGESGKANSSNNDKSLIAGGYNGGGGSRRSSDTSGKVSSGGGATHIANVSGLLSTLENKKSDILMVSGGGGGSSNHGSAWHGKGGHSGGYIGVSAYDCHDAYNGSKGYFYGVGGTQFESYNKLDTAGNKNGSFGKGAEVITTGMIGGGGGFYGGTSGLLQAGGGGSSYIGNTLLTNKAMYCYNCAESTEESTKTISTTCVNETPTSNCAKKGNGYVRITLIK